jgi:hypothetical protein
MPGARADRRHLDRTEQALERRPLDGRRDPLQLPVCSQLWHRPARPPSSAAQLPPHPRLPPPIDRLIESQTLSYAKISLAAAGFGPTGLPSRRGWFQHLYTIRKRSTRRYRGPPRHPYPWPCCATVQDLSRYQRRHWNFWYRQLTDTIYALVDARIEILHGCGVITCVSDGPQSPSGELLYMVTATAVPYMYHMPAILSTPTGVASGSAT